MLRTVLRQSVTSLLFAAAGFLMILAAAAPAIADVTSKNDHRDDAAPRLDISSVTYRNATPSVSARIRIPGLTRAGRAEFAITTTGGTDVAYVALVASNPNGTLRKRFVSRGNFGDAGLRCAFGARWNLRKQLITIAVPRRCLSNAGPSAHYLRADMAAMDGQERDYGPAAPHLARD